MARDFERKGWRLAEAYMEGAPLPFFRKCGSNRVFKSFVLEVRILKGLPAHLRKCGFCWR
jgi:hypothetical protein